MSTLLENSIGEHAQISPSPSPINTCHAGYPSYPSSPGFKAHFCHELYKMLNRCVLIFGPRNLMLCYSRESCRSFNELSPALKKPLSLAIKTFCLVVSTISHVMLTGVVTMLLSDT